MPTSVTLAAVALVPVPPLCCHLIQPTLAWLLTHLLHNLILPLPATRSMRNRTKEMVSHLPFGPQMWRSLCQVQVYWALCSLMQGLRL